MTELIHLGYLAYEADIRFVYILKEETLLVGISYDENWLGICKRYTSNSIYI